MLVAISTTGLYGAAAITTALAALGPFGMVGGIATLGVIGLATEAISELGFSAVFFGIVKQLYKQGESKQSIQKKIQTYPISTSLKLKLYESLEQL